MKSVSRLLRSRRFAVWLIMVTAVYAAVVTTIPQQAIYPADHASWAAGGSILVRLAIALGLDHGFSNAIFYALAMLLAVSTAACAYERSGLSLRLGRRRGTVSDGLARRLERSPDIRLSAQISRESAREATLSALGTLGMKARVGPTVVYAEAGALGLWGSPVFHWCLVAAIVVIAAGALTRWEGQLGVANGRAVVDEAASFGKLDSGPIALPHSGRSLELRAVDEDYRKGGVDYGFTPTVAVTDGGRELAVSRVHANHPLRHGPLLVHSTDHGLSVALHTVDPGGTVSPEHVSLLDFDETAASGTTPATIDVQDGGSVVASVSVEVMARDRVGYLPELLPPNPVAIVHVDSTSGESRTETVPVGGEVDVGEGWRLRLADVDYYARLTVVRDWSVSWLYALMGLAVAVLSLTVLVPYRAVWFQVAESGAMSTVDVVVRHYRGDHRFASEVERAVRSSLGLSGDDSDLPISQA